MARSREWFADFSGVDVGDEGRPLIFGEGEDRSMVFAVADGDDARQVTRDFHAGAAAAVAEGGLMPDGTRQVGVHPRTSFAFLSQVLGTSRDQPPGLVKRGGFRAKVLVDEPISRDLFGFLQVQGAGGMLQVDDLPVGGRIEAKGTAAGTTFRSIK
jgi:hypothetical protein